MNQSNPNQKSHLKNILDGNLLYVIIPLFFIVIYPMIASLVYSTEQGKIQIFGALLIIAIIIVVAVSSKLLNSKKIIMYALVIGIIIRCVYAFYNSIYARQHDVGDVDSFGHLGYILEIYRTSKLPEMNYWQLYHPPLHHIISAIWLKYLTMFPIPFDVALEGLTVVPMIFSSLTMVTIYKMLRLFNLSDGAVTISFFIVAFHPTFVILGGSINNDMVGIFLMLLSYYYAIKWYHESNFKNIILTAIFLALSALTKLSALMLALPIGFIFLFKLFDKNKKESTSKLWGQYLLFGAVSIPLSLSHSVRNLLKFEQPLGFVPSPGGADSPLFTGNYSFIDRFIKPIGSTFFQKAYCNPVEDYNLIEYLIKCSLFGEYHWEGRDFIAWCLIIVNIILILISLYSMFSIKVDCSNSIPIYSMLIFWAALFASHIVFNIKYPFGCTMDFRYIVPTIPIGVLFIGMLYDKLINTKPKLWKGLASIIQASILVFCVMSASFFLI